MTAPSPVSPGTARAGRSGRGGVNLDTELPKPTQFDQELGVRLTGMPFSESFGDRSVLHRMSEPSVRQLVEMRHNDGQARGLYRLLTMPVLAAANRATFLPAESGAGQGSGSGEEEAEFAETLLKTPHVSGGMATSLRRVISQMLLAVFDGFAAFELSYHRPKRGPLQGKYALRKIAYRPSETVSFIVDDAGEFDGIKQRTLAPNGKYVDASIDKKNSIYVAMNEEENPFYGVSFFNSAFYHYDKKIKLYYLAHLAAQHRAVGARLGKFPKSATRTQVQEFRRALADFGLAQSVTVPSEDGWTVEDLGKSLGDFPFMDFINHHNSQASKSVLAPFFDDSQGGAKSLVDFSNPGDSMYTMMIDVIVSEIESVINNWLLPRFIDWNFGSYKYPTMKFGEFSDEQKRAIKETFDKLSTAATSANVTRPFLLEIEKKISEEMGLEIDYTKVEAALDKQEKLTLQKFMDDAAAPPMSPPFQAVGANPADAEQGVPSQMQFIPGPDNNFGAPPPPGSVPGAPPGAPGAPPGSPGGPGFPALPSQMAGLTAPGPLTLTELDPASTYLGGADTLALAAVGDATAIAAALAPRTGAPS